MARTNGVGSGSTSVSAPFDLVADRSALLDCDWNTWLMGQAAELMVTLLTDDWIARFGSDAFLAIRGVTEAKPPAFAAALKKHLEEAACWPTAAGTLTKATELVIPEDPVFGDLLSASRYLRPDLAAVPELCDLVQQCGAKPFTRNSMIRLRCAPNDKSGLATKLAKEDADYCFNNYTTALAECQLVAGRPASAKADPDLVPSRSILSFDDDGVKIFTVVEEDLQRHLHT